MKKNKYQIVENELVENLGVSRSQKKRDSTALQNIGNNLIKLKESKLVELELSPELIEAIAEYKRLNNKEAMRRQMQFIGKLLRETKLSHEDLSLKLQDL